MSDTIITGQFPEANRVHRIVRLDYLIRLTTYPMFFLVYGVHLYTLNVSRWVWALFTWHLLVWPHVAKLVATYSRDTKKAEFRNLLIDSFFIGTAVPLVHFALWPAATGFLGINAGNVLNGGVRFALRGVVLFVAGAIAMGYLAGFVFDPLSGSLLTQGLSIALLATFTTIFSYHTFAQSQSVIRRGRMIREQATQIEEGASLLSQRSRELEAALVAAEAANEAKGNFLANMSHELRTPLNSIIGFGNILLRNRNESLREQDLMYLKRITANGAHLLTLINGVLDLSKIDAKQMQLDLTTVDVEALLHEALNAMEPQAEAREVELVADIPELGLLHTDRSRLRQIVLNLLGNAIKFTHKGRVTVRVIPDPRTGLPARIDVIDTGIGIAPDRVDAIFQAFQQEDTTTSRQYGGTGLGLTITRSLAHLMGWEIYVESEVGKGSTFSVMIARDVAELQPRQSAEIRAQVAEAALAAGADGHGPFRVLVIDDEFDARTIIRHQLEELGCEVLTASGADEGIALALRMRPDLITLDIMMPRKNGWDALREMKANALLREIPVVVVSVVAQEKRGRLLGAVDFIEKPVTRDSLVDVIRRNVTESTRPRVILIQDDPANAGRYRELAHADDMLLEIVTGIDEATVAIEAAPRAPELVVLDVDPWDPRVAAWVSSLRERPQTTTVRVVVVMSDDLIDAFKPLDFGATVLRRDQSLNSDLHAIVHDLRSRGPRGSREIVIG